MARDVLMGIRVLVAWGLILLNMPPLAAQEFGVVEDVYVGRHTISPFGGIGRYQNLLVRSEDQTATWADANATAVTVSSNLAAANPAPDGTTTADRLTQGASTAGAGRKQDVTLASAAGDKKFTFSVWLKAASAHTARLQMKTATNTQTAQNVSVDTTWQRFSTSYTVPTGDTNTTLTVIMYLDDGATYNSLDVWGAQLEDVTNEAETDAGVYVKTAGSAVSTTSRGLVSNTDLLVAGTQVTSTGLLDATKLTGVVPVANGGTGLSSTTANQLLYSSATNTIAGLATANSGVLVTSGAGVPSIATDLPTAVTIGSNYIYRATGTDVPVTDGGTGASDAAGARTNLGLAAGGAGDIWVEKAGDTMSGDLIFSGAQKILGGTATTADLTLQTTSGVGAAGADMHFLVGNNGATEAMTILNSGNVGIGTTGPDAKLTVSANTAALPAPTTGTVHFAGADATSPEITLDAFGGNPVLSFRRSNNTAASPSALAAGDTMFIIRALGYGSTAYSPFPQARAKLSAAAAENWTDTAQGTYLTFSTTPKGSTTIAEVVRIDDAGNVGIGTASPGAKLHTATSVGTSTPLFERSGQASDAKWVAVRTLATKTSDMGDGFGSTIQFTIQDDAAVVNPVGMIGAVRAGADNTGDLVFLPVTSGTGNERMRITSGGNVGIGTATPGANLDVNGTTNLQGALTANGAATFNTDVDFSFGAGENFTISTAGSPTDARDLASMTFTPSTNSNIQRVLYLTASSQNNPGDWNTAGDSILTARALGTSNNALGTMTNFKAGLTMAVETQHANSPATLADGILFSTTGPATETITDAIDASDAQITNALNFGGNAIEGTIFDVNESEKVIPAWNTTTALPAGRDFLSAIVANGYVYAIGGYNSVSTAQTTVYYAKLNTDGTLGTWNTTSALSTAMAEHDSAVINGYVYTIAGFATTTVLYAKLNADGTLGTWASTTVLPASVADPAVVAANGYLYVVGGGGTTIYYAKPNIDGTIPAAATSGTWTTTTASPTNLGRQTVVLANGYMYGTNATSVYYSKVNTNGTLGSWTATTSLPTGQTGDFLAATNGYLYALKSGYYARLNADGTVGTWTQTTSTSANIGGALAAANGYMYVISGGNATTVYYAKTPRIEASGWLDLTGATASSLTEGWNASSGLSAGSGFFTGTLEVADQTRLRDSLFVGKKARIADDVQIDGILKVAGKIYARTGATNSIGLNINSQVAGPACSDLADGDFGFDSTNNRIVWRILGTCHRWTQTGTFDVAEHIPASEPVEPGDVLVADPNKPETVMKSRAPYQEALMGVVSTDPYLISDPEDVEGAEYVAHLVLAGRVPVKVSLENGPIAIGDPITSSSTPGVAMKATEPGQSIGIALEAFDGAAGETGKILCFISVGERNTAEATRTLKKENEKLRRQIEELQERVAVLETAGQRNAQEFPSEEQP